jgi:hypothetical protein
MLQRSDREEVITQDRFGQMEAERLRAKAPVLLTPTSDTGTLVRCAGEALAWDPTPGGR